VLKGFDSPIAGGDGNQEFFIWAQSPSSAAPANPSKV